MKAFSHISFGETVELYVHFNVNPKVDGQIVRGTVLMLAGTDKKIIVAILCPQGYEQEGSGS
jgi:ribosomal protein L1